MKKLLLTITLAMVLLPSNFLSAQNYSLIAVDSVRWIVRQYDAEPWLDSYLYEYYALGDTVVNDTEYKKIYTRTLNSTNYNPPYPAASEYSLAALMRDDSVNKMVYSIIFNPAFTTCTVGEEVLLYDFSLDLGDTANHQCTIFTGCGDVLIEETGNGTFYGVATRYLQLMGGCSWGLKYFEGIGSERGLFEGLFTPVKGAKSIETSLDYYCPTSDCPYIVSSNTMPAPVGLSVYPNPAKKLINVEMSENGRFENSIIELYNIEGQLVYKTIPVSFITQVPFQYLSSGLYLLRVWDGSKWTVSKVVKE